MEAKTVPDTLRLEKGEKPTLKTIARLSGLAVPTVSRALNDAPDIKRATKDRVREIADQIGYVPNRAGVRLRTGRTNVISLVMSPQPDLTNHTGALISAIASGLEGTRFHMNVTPFSHPDDIMKPIKYIVETGSADAIIINQVQPEDPRVVYMMEKGFPFVTHGRTKWCDSHPYYDYDNELVGDVAARKFHHAGRSNILLIAPPREQNYAQHMIAGTRAAAQELGLTFHTHPVATSDMERVPLTNFIREALTENPKIDAIICGSSSAAMAAIFALEQIGRRLGQDIDVFAKEAVPILDWFRPDILTVFEDVGAAGKCLAQGALRAVREPEAPPLQILEKPTL